MKKSLLRAASVALWLASGMFASDKAAKQQEAIQEIEQATAKTNIFELPSFQMKASIQFETQGKVVDGTYELLWNGAWREEIRLPDYTEIQVGGKGTLWVQRSIGFLPLRIYDLRSALGFGSGVVSSLVQTGLAPGDRLKKAREHRDHGEVETCFEFELNESKQSKDFCVDRSTNTLVRDEYPIKDIQPVGGKVYPRFLSYVHAQKTLARVNITELTSPSQFSPNLFNPLPGVVPRAGCMNPAPAHLIKRVFPRYPDSARRDHAEGKVEFDAIIGVDGIPRIGKVVARASRDMEQSGIDALKEWRYEPATCNGHPVEVETILSVVYSLMPG